MAVGDGVTWNEALPDNSTLAHQIDDYNRDLRLGVRNRMAREHIWPSSQTGTNEGGHHQFITFQQQTSAPALSTAMGLTQVGALFVGSSGDGYPLCFENSAGTTFPIITAVSSIGTFTYGMAVVSSGTLGSIPICSSANPSTLTLLAGPTSTTATSYVLVSSNNATGGVQSPIWSTGPTLDGTNITGVGKYSGSTVFATAAAPTTWTDLDLSSVVGVNRAIVFLKVTAADIQTSVFRTNGAAELVNNYDNPLGFAGGNFPANGNCFAMAVTDTGGIIEWKNGSNTNTSVVLIGYIKLL
jgi:hypothetical protein